MAAHFDNDDDDSMLRLPIHINNRLHVTAGVLIKLIMKHKHFV